MTFKIFNRVLDGNKILNHQSAPLRRSRSVFHAHNPYVRKPNTQFFSYIVPLPEYICSLGHVQFVPQTTQTASTSYVSFTPTAGSDAATPETSDVETVHPTR